VFEFFRIVLPYRWSLLGPQHELAMEVLALRHQITVLKRRTHKPKLHLWDRCVWMILKIVWPNWRTPLMIIRPETVIGWQRARFRMLWRWKSADSDETGHLSRSMSDNVPMKPGSNRSKATLRVFDKGVSGLSQCFHVKWDRCLEDSDQKLLEELAAVPLAKIVSIPVPRQREHASKPSTPGRVSLPARNAEVEVRFKEVTL
jgi:hypothetical protein